MGTLASPIDCTFLREELSKLSSNYSKTFQESLSIKVNQTNCVGVAHALLKNPQLLDLCGKIAQIDTTIVLESAQQQALYMPEPKATAIAEKSTPSVSQTLLGKVTNIFRQLASFGMGFVSSIFYLDINKVPQTQSEAQGNISFVKTSYRNILDATLAIGTYYSMSQKSTFLIGLALFAALITGNKAYQYLTEVHKETELPLRNLTKEKRPKAFGRQTDLTKLTSCICAPPGGSSTMPMITGETGSGKTELVMTLAQEIRKGKIPQLQGKQVLYVNAADAMKVDGKHLTFPQMFTALEGHEKDVILFIDEFHTVGMSGSKGLILESLKTKFAEKGLTCILATTKAEYDQYVKPNTAFANRLQLIDLSPLDEESITLVLESSLSQKAASKIMEVSTPLKQTSLRQRLGMLDRANNYVYSWIPRKLSATIETLEKKIAKVKKSLRENEKPEQLSVLKELNQELETAKTKQAALLALHKSFLGLKRLKETYTERQYSLVHSIAKAGNTALQDDLKTLAWIQQAVLPALKMRMGKQLSPKSESFLTPNPLGR